MKRLWRTNGASMAIALAILIAAIAIPPMVTQAQYGGLRHQSGLILDTGTYITLTAGAAIVAHNAVYLSAASTVQKLTSAQAANFIGIAPYACASGATDCKVQITGVASAVCDGNVVINESVGGTGITPAGTLKTLASTLAASGAVVTSGAGTVTSGAATGTLTSAALTGTLTTGADHVTLSSGVAGTVTSTAMTSTLTSTATTLTSTAITQPSVTGTAVAYRTAGRAITACTDTGTFTVLLSPK